MATSCPASSVAAATQAKPRGKVGIFIFSVLAEMRRTLIALNLNYPLSILNKVVALFVKFRFGPK
jgi:hypothetical protein